MKFAEKTPDVEAHKYTFRQKLEPKTKLPTKSNGRRGTKEDPVGV